MCGLNNFPFTQNAGSNPDTVQWSQNFFVREKLNFDCRVSSLNEQFLRREQLLSRILELV